MDPITFNPDPKLQAQAMIGMFKIHCGPDIPTYDDGEKRAELKVNAKSCALIAARMCQGAVNETYMKLPDGIYMRSTYWLSVIEELEKS